MAGQKGEDTRKKGKMAEQRIRKVYNWQQLNVFVESFWLKPYPSAKERHDCHSKNLMALPGNVKN